LEDWLAGLFIAWVDCRAFGAISGATGGFNRSD